MLSLPTPSVANIASTAPALPGSSSGPAGSSGPGGGGTSGGGGGTAGTASQGRIRVRVPPSMLARQQTLPAKLASSPPQSPFQPNYRIAARPPSPLKWARKDPDSRAASPTSSLSVTPHSDLIPMKTQVNDRAVRKIMDLEIANESLLAVNTTLENTIREQALNMEQMRRMVGMMKRKLGVTDLDLSASASDAFDVSTEYSLSEDVLSASEFSSPSGGIIKKQFLDQHQQPFTHTIVEEPHTDPVDQKEVEIQYNRVCATIAQLIEDGNKALKARNPTLRETRKFQRQTDLENVVLDEKSLSPPMETTSKPQISTSSASAPASIHSSSRVVSPTSPVTKPVIPKSKITPINMTPTTTRLMKRTSSSPAPTKQPADPKQSLAQQPSLSRPAVAVTPSIEPAPDADRLHKKARLLITARRMYTSSTTSTALAAEDAAIEEEFDNPTSPTTVAIPRALYSSLVELVEAVHEDLLGSGEESGAGDRGAERGGGIIAGGFAIGIGSLSGAVMVGGAGKKEDVWTASSPPVEGKRRGVVARASSPAPGRMSSPVTARVASPVPGGGGVVRRSPLGGAATKAPRIQVTQRGVASAERRGLM